MNIRIASLLAALLLVPAAASADVSVSIRIAPPPLPIYEQPIIPGEGYIWIPGYWAYGDDDYYWVPGTWELAPEPGLLWTPAYWGWNDGFYLWHGGYWGPRVGFYGGINYGFGYFGNGYEGGRWEGRVFRYNRAVNNIDITRVHNTYNTTVVNNITVNRVSFNGGDNGTQARPSADQERAARERRLDATESQRQHERLARDDRQQHLSANHGQPVVAATPKPGAFNDRDVKRARNADDAPAAQNGRNADKPGQDAGRTDAPVNGKGNDNKSTPKPAADRAPPDAAADTPPAPKARGHRGRNQDAAPGTPAAGDEPANGQRSDDGAPPRARPRPQGAPGRTGDRPDAAPAPERGDNTPDANRPDDGQPPPARRDGGERRPRPENRRRRPDGNGSR